MRLIIAVAQDLFGFAYKSLFRGANKADSSDIMYLNGPVEIDETDEHVLPQDLYHSDGYESFVDVYEKETAEYADEEVFEKPQKPRRRQKNTVMYSASIDVPLRSGPRVDTDNTYKLLPYGSMVMVLEFKDEWARVMHGELKGWIHVDDLEDSAAHVYPQFSIGEANDIDDPNTIRLRAIINDEFGAGDIGLSLQAEEYILYKLFRRGIEIKWPDIRPRTPGKWSEIFKGVEGVTISSIPKMHTVMEITHPDEMTRGHVAYVEAVYPDGSVQISEANWPEGGIYNERVLVQEEWQQLVPMFLNFS